MKNSTDRLIENILESAELAMKEGGLDGMVVKNVIETVKDAVANNMEEYKLCVVVSGNPVEGCTIWGPFDSRIDAADWAGEAGFGGDWWVASVCDLDA